MCLITKSGTDFSAVENKNNLLYAAQQLAEGTFPLQ